MLHKKTLRNLLAIILLVLCSCTPQSPIPTPEITLENPLETQIIASVSAILENPILSQCTVGMHVVRARDNHVLFSKNADKLLHPASTTKLFTTVLALEYLGSDYQFTTQLATVNQHDKNSTNLYFTGAADPSLTSEDVAYLAKQLTQQSIQTIDTIICDTAILDDVQYGNGWMWDDQPYKDFAPISGLSINKNIVEIHLTPATVSGKPIQIKTIPDTSFVTITNSTTTTKGKTNTLEIARDMQDNQNTLTVSGTLGRKNNTIITHRNIEHPSLYAGTILKEECEKRGINVKHEPRRGITPENAHVIAYNHSLPLTHLITEMNKKSLNIYAELLLKTVAHKESHQQGSAQYGIELLGNLLEEWNIPKKGYVFVDGSGVSRYNLATPRTLTDLLMHLYNDENKINDFSNSLPIGGVDGDLDWRMKNVSAKQNIKAKTGYLRGVSTLAGFITTDSGEIVAFSIMMEHFNGSALPFLQIQDQLCEQLSHL